MAKPPRTAEHTDAAAAMANTVSGYINTCLISRYCVYSACRHD